MKEKGFTLTELLVVIVIMGIITGLSIPLIRGLSATFEERKYTNYLNTVLAASKLYNDSYSEDIFGRKEYGCGYVTYEQMADKDLLKDIGIDDITCATEKTFVQITKRGEKYGYKAVIGCRAKAGGEIKLHGAEGLSIDHNACTGSDDNNIAIGIDTSDVSNSYDKQKRITKLKLSSGTGINTNISISVAWSTNQTGYNDVTWTNKSITPPSVSEQNSTLLNGNIITVDSSNIDTPANQTGTYYLLVKVDNLSDLNGTSWKNYTTATDTTAKRVDAREKYLSFGPFTIDNTPPTDPTITAYAKTNGNDLNGNSNVSSLSTVTSGSWSKWLFLKASGSTDNSGQLDYYYKATGTTTNTDGFVKNSVRNVNAEGNSTIIFKACDKAGNCSKEIKYEAKLDLTGPTVTITAKDFNTFDWTVSDSSGSGVSGYQITNSSTSPTNGWTTSGTLTSGSYDVSSANTYYVWAKDKVGNTNKSSISAYAIAYDNYAGTVSTKPTIAIVSSNVQISNPTKSCTTTLENTANATVDYSGSSWTTMGTKTISYTFNGWTSNSSNGLESGAKTGTNSSSITTSWNGSATKNQYFKDLRSSAGTITMISTWSGPSFTLPKITKTGYVCTWVSPASDKLTRASGATYTPATATSRTFQTNCTTANTVTIRYNNGAGATTTADTTYTYATSGTITLPSAPTKSINITYVNNTGATQSGGTTNPKYSFTGWTYNGNTYTAGGSWNKNNPGPSYTLTAQWNKKEITLPTLTKTGNTCKWTTVVDGTTKTYNSGAKYTFESATSRTFTATCSANTITITYDANGGSGAPSNQTYTYATSGTITLSTTIPTRKGYTFKGWSLSSTASSASYSPGGSWNKNNAKSSYKLYAVWKDETPPAMPSWTAYLKTNCSTNLGASDDVSKLTTIGNSIWTNKCIFVKAKGGSDDGGSGFDHYEMTVTGYPNGDANNVTNAKQAYKNINRKGIIQVSFRSCDKAGNCSEYGAVFTSLQDRTAPTCEVKDVTNSSNSCTSTGRKIEVKCTDSASDSSTSDNSGCVSSGDNQGTRTLNSAKTYNYTVKDNAGNSTSCKTVVITEDQYVSGYTWTNWKTVGELTSNTNQCTKIDNETEQQLAVGCNGASSSDVCYKKCSSAAGTEVGSLFCCKKRTKTKKVYETCYKASIG